MYASASTDLSSVDGRVGFGLGRVFDFELIFSFLFFFKFNDTTREINSRLVKFIRENWCSSGGEENSKRERHQSTTRLRPGGKV